jgi:hypothetical protein
LLESSTILQSSQRQSHVDDAPSHCPAARIIDDYLATLGVDEGARDQLRAKWLTP